MTPPPLMDYQRKTLDELRSAPITVKPAQRYDSTWPMQRIWLRLVQCFVTNERTPDERIEI